MTKDEKERNGQIRETLSAEYGYRAVKVVGDCNDYPGWVFIELSVTNPCPRKPWGTLSCNSFCRDVCECNGKSIIGAWQNAEIEIKEQETIDRVEELIEGFKFSYRYPAVLDISRAMIICRNITVKFI